MIKSTKKKVAATVLSAALLLQVTPTFATPNTTTETTTTISTYEKRIEDLQTRIQKYDNRIIESIHNVQKLNKQVEESKTRVEKTRKEIVELEESYNRTMELSKSRLEDIQMNGSVSSNFIDILLSSDGISDFVQKTTAMMTIMESDKELSESLLKKDQELKEKKALLDKDLAAIQTKQEKAKQEQLKIKQEKAKIQNDLKQVQAAKKAAEEEARRIAEQQRQARIAAQAAAANNTTTENQQTTTQAPESNNNSSNNQDNSVADIPVSAPSASAASVIAKAKQYLGVPYVWGGTTPSGFDCSGFTSYVFRSVGISLPRVSSAQQNFGTKISTSQVQPGDLVFKGKPAYHVGIYIGGGQYIHAPQTGDVVKIASYNPSKFSSASRVLN
ncbi:MULTISPECIES: C40 family peptidase [Bacillus]|uniref:C40 family peptidase n=1 Tax=Bacillus TaxID=1386 RepID=UPI0003020EB3|nr:MULTISPECIES: C40 family peptidase [Bacillus]